MTVSEERAFELLKKMAFERVSGTGEERRAAEILRGEAASFGVSAEFDPFSVEDADVLRAELEVLSPFHKKYEVTGFKRSADTPDEGLTAGFLYVEDAAEALGSVYHGQKCGTFGHYGVLSFNGNKIITTSGGGALVCRDEADAQHALKMATQAREPVAWYEHTELGYNYRMSNICAGIGRGQMEVLEQRVAQKRAIHARYREALADLPLQLPAEPEDVRSNRWLTAALLAPDCGVTPGQIIAALAEHNIEARHIWKPMHLQPVFRDCAFVKTAERSVAEDVFARGVCLPSDTKMTLEQQAQVCAVIRGLF